MVVVSLSREALKAPEWLRNLVVAEVEFTLEEDYNDTVRAARVESIVYSADRSHVSTDVRITPALNNVICEIKVDE